uniref:USP domain-containing protein n=1 Tax=Panagrolaimus davidi TaxID=227884 RepID=A0A914QFA1_9BILA
MHCLSFEASVDIFNNCLLNFPSQHFTVNSFNEIASMLKYSKADSLGRTIYTRTAGNNGTLDDVINSIMQKIRDFLWLIILDGSDSVAHRAIEFSTCEMEDMADPERRNACAALFIDDCFLRLKAFEAVIRETPENDGAAAKAQRIAKSLKVLLVRYENSIRNRAHPPLYRASMGRCFQILLIFCKDDSKMKMPDARKILAVNSNWTMRYFYKQVLQMTSMERNRSTSLTTTTTTTAYKISERMDLLSYHPSGGTSGTEAQVRVLSMLTSMKNDRFPPLNSGIHTDTFRLVGRQSMRKTLGELHIDETTIFAARYAKSKRDTASFNFVSSMTQGDTPESSAMEESDEELEYPSDLVNEMPEIILATNKERIFFLMDLADLAHKFSKPSLRDEVANLLDHLTATDEICAEIEASLLQGTLYQTIITSSPTRTAFYFHVLHSLLTPVIFTEAYLKTEILFISTSTVTSFFQFIETALTSSNGYFSVINARILLSFARMIKLASTCYRKIQFFNRGSMDSKDDETILEMKNDEDTYYNAFVLDILRICFNNNSEIDRKALCQQAENYIVPMSILKSLMFVSWTASRCSINAVTSRNGPYGSSDDDDPMETSSTTSESSYSSSYLEDIIFAKLNDRSEAICEMLTLEALDAFIEASQFCPDTPQLFYTPPYLLEGNLTFPDSSTSQPSFYEFIIDVMLHSSSELIRTKIARSIFSLLQAFPETAGEPGPRANALLDILFANLGNAEINWLRCLQYFECLYRLMDYCQKEEIQPNDAEQKFQQVVQWLQSAKIATHENGSTYQREELLVCYLKTASHLLRLMPRSFRETLGYQGINFLQDLFDDFLMPFSKAYHTLEADEIQSFVLNGAAPVSPANSDSSTAVMLKPNKAMPICRSDASVAAGFALIADIVRDVPSNLEQALEFILQNFYSDFIPTVTNDQPQPYLQRDATVFVGLKNAGATCYMNSVIQQLFMIEPFRNAVLSAKCKIYDRDLYSLNDKEKKEKEYANQLIHSVQAMFAHVLASEEQFYTPVEFWDTFQ